jgi:isoleucyl-tRNA synthetase
MFDLNETINWKPKATGEGRLEITKCERLEFTAFQILGIPCQYGDRKMEKRRNLVGSVQELYEEIENLSQQVSKNPFKGFKIGNMIRKLRFSRFT